MAKKVAFSCATARIPTEPNWQKGKGPKGKASGDRDAWARTDVIEREHMRNERFEKYYKAQDILADGEWQAFLESMRDPLPTTFRVAGSRQ